MTKWILQPVDPFPDPTHAGQEIENVGILFAHLSTIFFMIILMIYFYVKIKDIIPIIITYMLSLIIGFICFTNPYMPFTPYFTIFFILIQSGFFLMSGMDYFDKRDKND